jgi:hypothetical protein
MGTRRTVRELVADCSKLVPEPPVAHREKRTVCALPADRLRATRAAQTICEELADCLQAPRNKKQHAGMDQTMSTQEHATNKTNTQ